MNSIEKLTNIFRTLPGVGPRQAKRFVYHILYTNPRLVDELATISRSLKQNLASCGTCMRFFEKKHDEHIDCSLCGDSTRDDTSLMIVHTDIDLESIEKKSGYRGKYFVLGGYIDISNNPKTWPRHERLVALVKSKTSLSEIILATNWTAEGEHTAEQIRTILLQPVGDESEARNFKITSLAKGISLGSEMEYIDPDTLDNALKSRS